MTQQLIQELQANRELKTQDQVKAFDAALVALGQLMDPQYLEDLYRVFTDATENHEVMWGLVHLVEAFEPHQQLKAMLKVLPSLAVEADEWAHILHYRILNNDTVREAYREVLAASAGEPGAAVARKILEEIARDEEPPLSTSAAAVLAG